MTTNLKKFQVYASNCPLAIAIKQNNSENVRFLLDLNSEHFLNLKYDDMSKLNPIGLACKFGTLDALKVLVEFGAN